MKKRSKIVLVGVFIVLFPLSWLVTVKSLAPEIRFLEF